MKILHTADWHLGLRLRRVDRGDDLRRAVGRVMDHCEREAVDVLLIAGDLFDSYVRPDDICAAIEHLKGAVRPFLRAGGTILALTGNHDHEVFCAILQHTLALADPSPSEFGERLGRGRFHLATRPTFFRLADPPGPDVQFVLMPYPTASRYLDGGFQPVESKPRQLLGGFRGVLDRMRAHARFDPGLQSVLAAHLYLGGVKLPNGREVIEADDVVCPAEDLGTGWAYVALGHVHKAQALAGYEHVRYSGSIERLRMDERDDAKGVVLVDVGPEGRRAPPATLPLDATPFYDVAIERPAEELPHLRAIYPEVDRALVRCRVAYTPGVDDYDAILRDLNAAFPRCYEIAGTPSGPPRPGRSGSGGVAPNRGFRETVLDYLTTQLGDRPEAAAVLAAAESLIAEARP